MASSAYKPKTRCWGTATDSQPKKLKILNMESQANRLLLFHRQS